MPLKRGRKASLTFKGLEAAVVFLCGFETAASGTCPELLYVGLSRAKSRVFLVGSDAAISACFVNQR
jgi:hypothetical protein